MPTVDLSPEQVVAMVEQLSPEAKLRALAALARGARENRGKHHKAVAAALARLARSSGRDWEGLSEAERLEMVSELVHDHRASR